MSVTSYESFMAVLPDRGESLPTEVTARIRKLYDKYAMWQNSYEIAEKFHYNNKSGIDNSTDIQKNLDHAFSAKSALIREIASVKLSYYANEVTEEQEQNNKIAM